MNWEFMKPILAQAARDTFRTAGMFLLSHGVIQNGAGVEAFVGAGMTLAGILWGWWTTKGSLQVEDMLKKMTAMKTTSAAVVTAKAIPVGASITVGTPVAPLAKDVAR